MDFVSRIFGGHRGDVFESLRGNPWNLKPEQFQMRQTLA
jgi:hypothetical protein